MFLAASAIRALLTHGIALHGSFAGQLADGTVLAAGLNNLPAAAALHPAGPAGLWAAILAAAIGPDLLITGSVATLICRRIARDAGAALSAGSSPPSEQPSSRPSSPPPPSGCTSPARSTDSRRSRSGSDMSVPLSTG